MTDGGGGTEPAPPRGSPTGGPPGRRDDGGPATPSPLVCELCGGPVLDRHCKIVCLNCGYQRDCSDP